jgi:hypothetical protein
MKTSGKDQPSDLAGADEGAEGAAAGFDSPPEPPEDELPELPDDLSALAAFL